MNKALSRRIICTAFFIVSIFCNVFPQSKEAVRLNESYTNEPLSVFLSDLGEKYGLTVYYKPEWIEGYTITKTFRDAPLRQALNNVFLEHELTYQLFQDDAIVVFRRSSARRSGLEDQNMVMIIGDPLNTGRYSSAELSGKVLDGKTGDPLTGAVVYNNLLEKGATTDGNGEFNINFPAGDHRLQFSYVGFEDTYVKIRLIEDGYAEFSIFEETHNLDEVIVVGEETDLPRSQMSMVQMSTAEMKRLPTLMGEVDVLKVMALQAGVTVVSELSSGFNVRGGNTDQNLILVNGSPVFNSSHLFGFLSLINPDMVKNVRLFKGGMPVKYGERVASVMEVGFREGNSDAIQVRGGIGLINSRLSLEGPLSGNKKLTFMAGGRSSYTSWILKEIPQLDLTQSVTNFYDLSGKVTYKFDAHNKLNVMGYFSDDEFSTSSQSVTQYSNSLGNLKLNTRFSENLHGELDLSFSQYDYRLTDYANGKTAESYYLDNSLRYQSAGYHVRWHPTPRHNTEYGAKMIMNRIDPGAITPVDPVTVINPRELESEKSEEYAFYLGDEFEILPEFTISAGIRYSRFRNTGAQRIYLYDPDKPVEPENVVDSLAFGENEVSAAYGGIEPRFSVKFDLDINTALKMNYQRTRQYIFQLSNNAVVSPAETWKAADIHLKPLISDQVAIGIENNSWMREIEFSGEVYFKQLQNLIEYKNGAKLIMNEHIETALIPTRGYSYGIEVSAEKPRGRLTGSASYVFSRTMRKNESLFDDDNLWKGKYYPSIYDKPHDFSANATYNISRRWRMSGNFVFISGRPVTLPELKYEYSGESLVYFSDRNKYRMPPYHRLDVSITFDENLRKKRMWKGSWTLSVYNLYGRNNPYSVYYKKSQPGQDNNYRRYSLFKLSVIGIPIPSLTYNFTF